MAVLHFVPLAALFLEDQHLVGLYLVQNGCADGYALDGGRSDGNAFAVVDQQHLVKRKFVVGLGFLAGDVQRVVLGHLVLFPCNFYNRVHWVLCFGAPDWVPTREERNRVSFHGVRVSK